MIDGGQGGNAGLKSEGLDPASTVVKIDNNGCSWPVLLDGIMYGCVVFDVLKGSGLWRRSIQHKICCPPRDPLKIATAIVSKGVKRHKLRGASVQLVVVERAVFKATANDLTFCADTGSSFTRASATIVVEHPFETFALA